MDFRFKSLFLAGCLGSALVSHPTAVNSTHRTGVIFGGTVGNSRFCEVLIVSEGWLEANSSRNILGSTQVGGKSGVAQIRSSRNLRGSLFRISAETPVGFDIAPAALGPDVEFSADYQATVTVFNFFSATGNPGDPVLGTFPLPTLTPATSILLPRLATRSDINVNFEARTVNDAVFPPGQYQSHITLSCE